MLVSELRIFIIQRVFNCMSVIVSNSIVSISLGTQMILSRYGVLGKKGFRTVSLAHPECNSCSPA